MIFAVIKQCLFFKPIHFAFESKIPQRDSLLDEEKCQSKSIPHPHSCAPPPGSLTIGSMHLPLKLPSNQGSTHSQKPVLTLKPICSSRSPWQVIFTNEQDRFLPGIGFLIPKPMSNLPWISFHRVVWVRCLETKEIYPQPKSPFQRT